MHWGQKKEKKKLIIFRYLNVTDVNGTRTSIFNIIYTYIPFDMDEQIIQIVR